MGSGMKANHSCPGACHCGAVRFEVDLPGRVEVSHCNCSICSKTGYVHLIVPRERFRLLTGEAELTEYRFNTGTARHLFCRHCGVKAFYAPRSHPDAWSVNLNCVDTGGKIAVTHSRFDGRNWRRNIETLRQSGILTE